MKFDVVIGNVVPSFRLQEDYGHRSWRYMQGMGKIIKFMEPEEWIAIFSQIKECTPYAELRYALTYDPEYFTRQINEIVSTKESGDTLMYEDEKLLILISRQLLVLSKKVDALSEKLEDIASTVDTLNLDDLDLSVDTDEVVEKIVDQIKDLYIDSVEDYLELHDCLFIVTNNRPSKICNLPKFQIQHSQSEE